jgi:hypothetical protein
MVSCSFTTTRSPTLFRTQFPRHDAAAATPRLIQYSGTLKTLGLKTCCFSYDAASVLLPRLGAVRTLELFFWAMSPDLLHLFAEYLPKPHSLRRNAGQYSRVDDRIPQATSSFIFIVLNPHFSFKSCKALKSVRFPDWQHHYFQFELLIRLHVGSRIQLLGAFGESRGIPSDSKFLYKSFQIYVAWITPRRNIESLQSSRPQDLSMARSLIGQSRILLYNMMPHVYKFSKFEQSGT